MREQRVVVELEVGRRDHGDGFRTCLGGSRGKRYGVRGRLRATVRQHRQRPRDRVRDGLFALRQRQEDPFAGGARRAGCPRSRRRSGSRGTAARASSSSSRPPSRSGVRAAAIVLAIAAMLVPATARASDLLDLNASHITLEGARRAGARRVHARTAARGTCSPGARSTRARPARACPQVRFEHDYSGGLKLERRAMWKTFADQCRPYDGPPLAYLVVACKAPDGSYWALQSWQRDLPHRGVAPWTAAQSAWELRLSHWVGAAGARRALHRLGVPGRGARHLRPSDLRRQPGLRLPLDLVRRADGLLRSQPLHRHLRLGLRAGLEAGDVDPLPQADRRVLLLVLADPRRLAARAARRGPPGTAARYRISVVGPGVTPDVVAEAADPGRYDAGLERQRDALFTRVIAGDRFCSTQH